MLITGKIGKKKLPHRIKKPYNLDYWRQKQSLKIDLCVSGEKIQSNDFLLHSTVYTTCNEEQPFVFCPSNETASIIYHQTRWMCIPTNAISSIIAIPPNIISYVYIPEIRKIVADKDTIIEFKKGSTTKTVTIEEDAYILDRETMKQYENFTKIKANKPITLYKNALVSNPPSHCIKFNDQGVEPHTTSNPDAYYLLKRDGYTHADIEIDSYDINESNTDFYE